jgi:type I restriction enzyme S subunit
MPGDTAGVAGVSAHAHCCSSSFRRYVFETAGGTKVLHTSPTKIEAYRCRLPPVTEQIQIARILDQWDTCIKTLEGDVSAKADSKRGLMQQLLTGRNRFKEFVTSVKQVRTHFGPIPADWPVVCIGDIADEVGEKNGAGHESPVLSCTKHRGLVNSLEYFGKRIYNKDTSGYRVVRRGDFAYATNHIEEGSIGYQNLHEAALISPMYTVFRTKPGVDHSFFFKLLKTELYRHTFETNTNGSINRRGALRWDDFANIKVHLPGEREQRRIVAVLEVCDREIELLQKQLEALKEQKRGLMQKLLTGEIRIKC